MKYFLMVLGVIFFAPPIKADISVSQYNATRNSELIDAYIAGIGMGAMYSSLEQRSKHGVNIYCPPEEWGHSTENLKVVLDNEIMTWGIDNPRLNIGGFSIELLLIRGLKNKFPCSK